MPIPWPNLLDHILAFSPGDTGELRAYFAPGRVNLIGEHTDYNGGYVLPAALTMGTWLVVRPRADRRLRFATTFSHHVVEVDADDVQFRPEQDFANYPLGVIDVLGRRGVEAPGMDLFFFGNLPIGAGLSSSASVEVVTAFAINDLTGAGLDCESLAVIAQQAENEFVGVNCGVMDQFSVAMGKKDMALSLNCLTLAYELVPVHSEGYRLVIANSNAPRKLAGSKYNERRAECEAALAVVKRRFPDVQALAEIEPSQWSEVEALLRTEGAPGFEAEVVVRRARHVIMESHRAREAARLLADGNIEAFGELMNASHRSLRDDYEVTGEALDALVEAAWSAEGCIGSRMTGAGFGGCTVSLVRDDAVEAFTNHVQAAYQRATGRSPSFYVTDIGDGVHALPALDAVVR
ncbi:MAG: galactokinase [Alicyclobacillus mali]|uniref:galactokinase n=1 Tax=Alicyclobacillus mali (ex Roth et al. 2021) TaxID=1123961 RepID=UPI0023F0F95D|nr:galactokinase [Alicyclobacillus mali (ex Roth et al. 2021)]MCL6487579.1 galactokinase [Alicyclobacillus mali (ex Roth et al. 2021)]